MNDVRRYNEAVANQSHKVLRFAKTYLLAMSNSGPLHRKLEVSIQKK